MAAVPLCILVQVAKVYPALPIQQTKLCTEDNTLRVMSFPWQNLTALSDVDRLCDASYKAPQVIFKHSTRCNISSVALRRFEAHTPRPDTVYHFLDLINYRHISNAIAEVFNVYHESPQVLLISKGECIYDESHFGIQSAELEEQIKRILA